MKETTGYLNFRKYFLGGVDPILKIGHNLLRNTMRESILCYSILYSLQNCLALDLFLTGQECVHKMKKCIFSLGSGAVPQTNYCKELEKYSRTDLDGSIEEPGTSSAQQFNIFLRCKNLHPPSTSICRLSNIEDRFPCSVLWYWSGISSNFASILGLAGILRQQVRWMDCRIASHLERWLK